MLCENRLLEEINLCEFVRPSTVCREKTWWRGDDTTLGTKEHADVRYSFAHSICLSHLRRPKVAEGGFGPSILETGCNGRPRWTCATQLHSFVPPAFILAADRSQPCEGGHRTGPDRFHEEEHPRSPWDSQALFFSLFHLPYLWCSLPSKWPKCTPHSTLKKCLEISRICAAQWSPYSHALESVKTFSHYSCVPSTPIRASPHVPILGISTLTPPTSRCISIKWAVVCA